MESQLRLRQALTHSNHQLRKMSSTIYGFKEDDKLTRRDDFHAWKMILDLKLEDHDLMDYVLGKI